MCQLLRIGGQRARTEGQLVIAGALQAAVAPHSGHAEAVRQPYLRSSQGMLSTEGFFLAALSFARKRCSQS